MIFAMRLSLGSAWAYAILWFPPTERASDTQCVFVFLCFFLPKNTKTHWPNVSLSFFNIRIAPDSLCVFVFLCFFPKNTKTHWPNVSLSFFNIRIAPDSLCVFVFLCFFPENTKTHWPIFFLLPNNKIAPESQCVFVFLCFFLRKAQKHIDKMFLCLFLTLWLHQTAYVFLCFFRKTQKHIDPILLKVDCGRKFAILSISVWPKKFKCRRNMKSCTFKQKPHQNCSQFLLQEWREESFSSGYQKYYMVDWTFCWIAKKMEWGTHFHNLVWLDSEGSEGTTCCDKKQLLHLITKQNAA